jgi:hypothetical protein
MKICAVAFSATLFCVASSCFAQSAPPVQEITRQIIKAATSYSSAIACEDGKIGAKDIAALVPYKTLDDRPAAMYAILWGGDIGCAGGSGTHGTHVSIVMIGAGDSYFVDPLQSSPVIQFESPVRYVSRIVGNTRDSMILEGLEYGPKDANCCPSVPVRFTLKVDEKGNWKLVDKKVMPVKK